ncbi:MAG: nicotinate (nicotinamide) nucleotide adenylyltransferase [Bacteroidaceae bacterium]|nr:nicotinate (nicotinamide) nucleotide adenylyltransferase [Bacteroidaceae bacterium]
MRIAVFGGTFNPIHNGHVAIARSILDCNLADKVWLMITPCNPWKQDQLLPANDIRLKMAAAAVRDIPGVEASAYEFGLPIPQYSASTLKSLKKDYPEHEFILAIGADNWIKFTGWREWQYIIDNFGIIVYPRHGYGKQSVPAELEHARVTWLDCPLFNVSSTQIRSMAASGDDVSGLVPAPALEIFLDTLNS